MHYPTIRTYNPPTILQEHKIPEHNHQSYNCKPEDMQPCNRLNYHSNGTKSRKNKILLSFIKNRALLDDAVKTGNYELLHISDMQTLKQVVIGKIRDAATDLPYCVTLIDKTYGSCKYSTDASNGICEDDDYNSIRYINHENNDRIFKMKCGKFFRTLILDTPFGQSLPESLINWLCKEFTLEWKAYAVGKIPQNTLFVNDDFERIYSSKHLQGNFGSCMVNRGLHSFYKDSVKAKAAYLENSEGMVIARCIIYTEVFTLVVFNYIFGNGDAHLKNFSLQQTASGDYLLTPAYDLLNTSIHVDDNDFALQDGLMPKESWSDIYKNCGHPCKEDFVEFGKRIGVLPKKINEIIEMFATENPMVYELIDRSFLDDRTKRMYKRSYQERLSRFQRSTE